MSSATFVIFAALAVAVGLGLMLVLAGMMGRGGRTRPCPKCGNENRADAQFCARCGGAMNAGDEPDASAK